MLPPSDHDLLVSMANDLKRVVKALDGNGQPGLIQKVAVLEQDMKERQHEADDIRASLPHQARKTAITGGVITSILIAVFTAAKTVFFP